MNRAGFGAVGWVQVPVLLLLVLFCSKVNVPFIGSTLPLFPLMIATYYWALFREHVAFIWVVAIGALLQDVLLGLPLGVSVAAQLSAWVMLLLIRRMMRMDFFVMIWISFMPVVVWSTLVMGLLVWMVDATPVSVFMQRFAKDMAFTWLVFPLVYRVFHLLYARSKQSEGQS